MGKLKPVLRAIEHPRRQGQRLARSLLRTTIGAADEPSPRDVWKWTASKYRSRTFVLLLVNAALFAGLGFFMFWLRTGAYSPFSADSYWASLWQVFNPTQDRQITLVDYLVKPIPADQVPIMIVVIGLVLASMTAIPILVSMLYRFPFSLIFTATIGFVALFPWLAITITFCCFLARWRPFRFSFRFATALLSLIPVAVYYALATRNSAVAEQLGPGELAKLYVPWVFAMTAACVIMGVVLGIARLVNDRPGAIAPLMAIMFVLPIALFEVRVGRDELYYRLIEQQFGPDSTTYFVRTDASDTIEKIARKRLEASKDPQVTLGSMEEQVRNLLQFQSSSIREDWEDEADNNSAASAQQQYEAVRACKKFLDGYPHSPYCANVLYIEGRALDIRLDRDVFWRKGIVQYYDDFPNMASMHTWERLVDEHGDSPLASVAMYRLGLLRARAGDMAGAAAVLKQLIGHFGHVGAQSTQPEAPAGFWQVLSRRSPRSLLRVEPSIVAMQGRKLLALIDKNPDPHQKDLVLRTLLSCDPHDPMYLRNLEQILGDIERKYPLTALRDNIEVELAAAQPSQSLKIRALETCVQRLARDPNSDAYPQAQYELGLAYQADNRTGEARAIFESIVNKQGGLTGSPGTSPWAMEAQRHLAEMGARNAEWPQ